MLTLLRAKAYREAGERKKKARGERPEGLREEVRPRSRLFSLPIVHGALTIFNLNYCYFYWNTKRVPLRRRETCVCSLPWVSCASVGALSFVFNRWPPTKTPELRKRNNKTR